MRQMALISSLVLLLGLFFPGAVHGQASEKKAPKGDYIKIEARGTLKTGIVAIGGETTGIILTTKGGTVELDVRGNKKLMARVKQLKDKKVIVTGILNMRRTVTTRRLRLIVKVATLKSAEK